MELCMLSLPDRSLAEKWDLLDSIDDQNGVQ